MQKWKAINGHVFVYVPDTRKLTAKEGGFTPQNTEAYGLVRWDSDLFPEGTPVIFDRAKVRGEFPALEKGVFELLLLRERDVIAYQIQES